MAGGSGTRFWPKSVSARPKQLLSFGESSDGIPVSLLARTLRRFEDLIPSSNNIIVTTRALRDAVSQETASAMILEEPAGRNTAPCIYWAARFVAEQAPNAVMLVMPSDHYIAAEDRFCDTVKLAVAWASEHDDLVTLGVRPSRPETGFGYLRISKNIGSSGCYRVERFIEKPNEMMAKNFLKSGNYLWNGGMFVWRAEVILAAFDCFMPEMKKTWEASGGDVDVAYPLLTATSIDYGVMEKADNVVAFPLDCGWDDLGSWLSLESMADVLGAYNGENVVTNGEVISIESAQNIIDAPGKLVALLGVKDLIIVQAGEAILVADKRRAQQIKMLVDEVKKHRPDLV